MPSSFRCYIDESGCEGFRFSQGSSNWFILAGLIIPTQRDIETADIINEHRRIFQLHPKKPLHWKDMPHEQRIPLTEKMAESPARIVAVCMLKNEIRNREIFAESPRMYFYAVRLLLERITWYIQDHIHQITYGDHKTQLIFSNRGGMPYDELRNYLSLLKQMHQSGHDIRIDFTLLRDFEIYTPGKRKGLQLADACAGAIYNGLQAHPIHGTVQPAYIKILSRILFKHGGTALGYGLKFWPREAIDAIKKDPLLQWVETIT